MPGLSPGKLTPVVPPKPQRCTQRASSPGPSFSAIVTVPTLDECDRMCSTVIRSVLRVSASWIVAVGDADRRWQREAPCAA